MLPSRKKSLARSLGASPDTSVGDLMLQDGARVAVIGGGPAGSFFTYFLLKMAATVDLRVDVDIWEPRSFANSGPAGCNHCGGIVSSRSSRFWPLKASSSRRASCNGD
jgi:flavin-dependent dehydrogenase